MLSVHLYNIITLKLKFGSSPSASALAVSSATPAETVLKLDVDAASKASIDMPAPKEHIKADTTAAKGTLDLVQNQYRVGAAVINY